MNYAIVLFNNGKVKEAKDLFQKGEIVFKDMDEEDKEPEMLE